MRWRMIAAQSGVELRFTEGDKTFVADALSRLELEEYFKPEPNLEVEEIPQIRKLAEIYPPPEDMLKFQTPQQCAGCV